MRRGSVIHHAPLSILFPAIDLANMWVYVQSGARMNDSRPSQVGMAGDVEASKFEKEHSRETFLNWKLF